MVSTYEEFQRIGREKLGLGKAEPIRVVLESDGTQVHTTMYKQIWRTYRFDAIIRFLEGRGM